MSKGKGRESSRQDKQIRALAAKLAAAENALEAALPNQIDAVVDAKTATPILLRRAQSALRESESKYRLLFESNPLPMWVMDSEMLSFLAVNEATIRHYGYSREEFLAMTIKEIPPLEDIPAFLDAVAKNPPGLHRSGVWRHRKKDGTIIDVEMFYHSLDWEGKPARLMLAHDITERIKAQEALRQLSGSIIQLQDEERRRIARELHDSTAQTLTALAINLAILQSLNTGHDPQTYKVLKESLDLAEQAGREIRNISHLLHPPDLDEVGLAAAIRSFAASFSERSGIDLDLDLPSEIARVPKETEVALLRVTQESLANVHRHSGSSTAKVRLALEKDGLTLEVEDDGSGMPSDVLQNLESTIARVGIGIAGMRARLRQLGGRLEIESGTRGTKIRAVVPLFSRGVSNQDAKVVAGSL